ncbi:MAG: S-layer homology domain-containing protein [Clostridia bacterium]|nr:S-layer homology domain-containing protein [Clostridia bacterium]
MMKRKILCTLLATVLLFTSFSVSAVKREQGDTSGTNYSENILGIGSFKSEQEIEPFISKNCVKEWSEKGATADSGSMKITTSDMYGYATIDIPNIIGETYDVSFWAKVEKGTQKFSVPMRFSNELYGKTMVSGTLTTTWQEFHFSYTADGKAENNANSQENSELRIFCLRLPNGVGVPYYLDELKIVPHGNTDFDWSKQKKIGYTDTASRDIIPADDGFATEIPVNEVSFSDICNHWADREIELLAANGVINGMGDGTFVPEGMLTRAQFVKLIMNLMKLDPLPYKGMFTDVSSEHWIAGDLQSAYELGFIHPVMTAGNKFLPDTPITREEAAYMLLKYTEIKSVTNRPKAPAFSDSDDIANWANAAVGTMASCGVISGYPDGSFRPKGSLTRAESAMMLYRLTENNSRLAVYVDGENGDDKNLGTKDAPLKTIEAARDFIRPYLDTMQNHIYVFIQGGEPYRVTTPIAFGTDDSGENGYRVIYTAWDKENEPVISGGKDYSGFTLHDSEKNIWKTYVGAGTIARQIYINGIRATRSMNDPSKEGYMNRKGVFKNPVKDLDARTITCDNTEYASFTNQNKIEAVFCEEWTNPRLKVEKIYLNDEGKCVFKFQNESFDINHVKNNTNPSDGPMWLENAYELINAEGEWYLNETDGYLYYKPRKNENPETMVATVPIAPQLIWAVGDSAGNKLHNISFDHIVFESSTWTWPSTAATAYNDEQLNNLPSNSVTGDKGYVGDGRVTGICEDAALTFADVAYVDINNCTVKNTGGAGINFRQIFQHCNLLGNHVYNTAGGGINMGCAPAEGGDPEKFRKPEAYERFRIYNNIMYNNVHDCGLDYRACVGISASWLKNTKISYNEIYNINYSGMHIGWGWASYATKGTALVNVDLSHNYIHDTCKDFVCDSGGIYVLGATGGWEGNYNQIRNNYFENMRGTPTAIYPDEGSTFWEIHHNVVDIRETGKLTNRKYENYDFEWLVIHQPTIVNNYVHDNYATNDKYRLNSTGNKFENAHVYRDANWPEEAQKIIDEAGIPEEYHDRYPDTIQRLMIPDRQREYVIKSGETLKMNVVGFMRKLKKVEIPYENLYFWSSNEEVATVDNDGVITGVGAGRANVHAQYLDGDVWRDCYMEIVCDDAISEIVLNREEYYVLQGETAEIDVVARTENSLEIAVPDAIYTVEDESVATVDEKGNIRGLKVGTTKVHAEWKGDGVTKSADINVHVIRYVQDDTLDFIEKSEKVTENHPLLDPASWSASGVVNYLDGITLANTAPLYFNEDMQNRFLSFDVSIHNPNSWPSFTLGTKDTGETYSNAEVTYLIGVKPTFMEMQRFNKGVRSMIFGEAQYSPVGGVGRPNTDPNGKTLFPYNTRCSVTIGSTEVEGGTRIVFIVNGVPVYDYVDTAENRGHGFGMFGVYAFQGNFVIQPYTGINVNQ